MAADDWEPCDMWVDPDTPCGRPALHQGGCRPVPFESDKTASEEGR